ncbi:MAG TPA: FAD-dependent oxidoreductase [Burkholderiales bacterium]|nr:FAD-dependent oxidoreductase [Burkholderiales bacterium]
MVRENAGGGGERLNAEIVIIGGGAIGCSIAYHLSRLSKKSILLVEKAQLTHGSTWHAAGLVGQLRSKRNLTRLMQNSVALYRTLERETGQAIDWHEVGSVRLASSAVRWSEMKRAATTARGFGFEMALISPKEAQEKFPFITLQGIHGAAWVPSDGYVDPSSLAQALAKGARAGGVRILQNTRVTGFEIDHERVKRVLTDKEPIACETIVIAAGIWSRAVGALMGVKIPAAALEHQYVVTEPMKERNSGLPTLRDPDKNFYLKPEVGGFAVGGWEMGTPAFHPNGVPFDFAQELLAPNMARFEEIALATAERVPAFGELGFKQLINGPIPVSPDGEPIMGRAIERHNVFVACGFTSGIAAAGGAGRAMAEWILQGAPEMDLWPFDLCRFGDFHSGTRALHERAVHAYGSYYHLHYPGEELTVARDARRSPLWQTLKERGAVYGSKFGWERPNWFAPPGVNAGDNPSLEGKPNWFEHVAAEHRATRERVALFDLSSFTKFELTGRGALAALQRIAANDLDKPDGAVVYTQLCNEKGGIEADLTIVRLSAERFYIVTGSGFGVRDGAWIRNHLAEELELRDITSSRSVINVQGPRSRDLLSRITENNVSNEAFPYLAAREIRVGYAPVLALRVTYAGELGWELHVPGEYALHVYEALWSAGQDLGVANAGYRALDSLRLEKGYRYWSSELSPDTNPYEAGLGFAVALKKKEDFIGRKALERIKSEGVKRKLACFLMDGFVPLHGGEAILHQGRVIETVTSGGYGHTLGKSTAYGFVPAALLHEGHFELESFGVRYPARVSERAPYDPDRRKITA